MPRAERRVIASEAPCHRERSEAIFSPRDDNAWSAAATWACFGAMLAGGLTPCVIYATATHRYGWAILFALTLLPAAAVPVYLTVFAGRRNLRLYAGSLYLVSGLWVLLWSASPDVEGYVRDGLLGSGGFLFLLGLVFVVLYLSEGQPVAASSAVEADG